jgi:gluconolactonase
VTSPAAASLATPLPGTTPVAPAALVSLLEGPAFGPDGWLYFSDIPANRLMRHRPGRAYEIYRENAGRPNGNVFDLSGDLLTCEGAEYGSGGGRRIVRTNLDTGERSVITDRFEGKRYNSPNDICVDSRGRIFFTDPRYGERDNLELDEEAVYRIDPGGSVSRILGQPEIQRPNGVAVSLDDRTLYVVDSNHDPGGHRCVWAFGLDDAGEPHDPEVVHDFSPGRGGDGIEVDSEGSLFVCAGIRQPRTHAETTLYAPGVYVFGRDRRPLGMVPVPDDLITNCCFGDDDLRTLYITAGRTVFRARVRAPGYHAFPSSL